MYSLRNLTEEEFDYYAQQVEKGSFHLTTEMAKLKQRRHHAVYYLGLQDGQQDIKIMTILVKQELRMGFFFEISGGFLALETSSAIVERFVKELLEFAKNKKAMYVQIQPNLPEKMKGDDFKSARELTIFSNLGFESLEKEYHHDNHHEPLWEYKKDLSLLTEETLLASYKKNARYNLKKAYEFGVTVRAVSYEELPYFKLLIDETAERRGFADKTLDYYQQVYEIYEHQATFLVAEISMKEYLERLNQRSFELSKTLVSIEQALLASPNSKKKKTERTAIRSQLKAQEQRIITAKNIIGNESTDCLLLASALFLFSKFETVYLFSGSNDQYSQFYAPYVIQHEMMLESIRRGIPLYNFYGIPGHFDGSDGILRFKESFNGYIEKQVAPMRKVTSNKFYLYKTAKQLAYKWARE